MDSGRKWQKGSISISAAALIAAGLSALTFIVGGKTPGGDHIFLTGDYYVQYIHFIKMFWRNLLNGNGLAYSFEFSLGQPVWAIYAYYSLSPCNLPFVLLHDVDTAAFIAVLIREALAAAAFCFFARRILKADGVMPVCFSVLYALCGYSICFYYNVNLLDAMYQLPLIACGIWQLVYEEKKNLLTGVLAYSFSVCFYSGFQLGVFSVILFLGILFYRYDTGKFDLLKKCAGYVQCVLTAVLISAVITLPTAEYLFRNRASDVQQFRKLNIWIWDVFVNFFIGQEGTISTQSPMIYCGLTVIILLPFLFVKGITEKRDKILFLFVSSFLLICALFDPLYQMMHAFDMPDGSQHRYAYMFAFVFLTAALYAWEKGRASGFAGYSFLGIALAWIVIYLVLSTVTGQFKKENISYFVIGVNILFLIALPCMFRSYASGKKVHEMIIAIVILTECALNGIICRMQDSDSLIRTGDYYKLWQKQAEAALEQIAKEDTEHDFYRISVDNPMHNNEGCFFGYHGLGYFSTIENAVLRKTLSEFGYYTMPAALHENGSTEVMQMILGQRYKIHATYPLYEEEDRFKVSKVKYVLPIAYMVSDKLKDYQIDPDDPFKNQNELIRSMLGEESWEAFSDAGDPKMQCRNMQLIGIEGGFVWKKIDNGQGSIRYTIPAKGNRAYAYFSDIDRTSSGGDLPMVATALDGGDISAIPYLAVPRIMEMGVNEEGEYEADIFDREGDDPYAVYRNAYFAYYDQEALQYASDQLGMNAIEISDWNEHSVCGRIYVGAERTLLFTSIPYDRDWKIRVDGKEVESLAVVNGCFLAADLEEGEHKLELFYADPMISYGAILSAAGIILWLGAIVFGRISSGGRNEEKEKQRLHAA